MKVEVVRGFVDKHTGKGYSVGDTLEVTDARFAEISKAGVFVKPIQDTAEQTEPGEKPKRNTKTKK